MLIESVLVAFLSIYYIYTVIIMFISNLNMLIYKYYIFFNIQCCRSVLVYYNLLMPCIYKLNVVNFIIYVSFLCVL